MRISIYARVSTRDGRQDLENQLSPLREWATRLGGKIVTEYVDEVSGSKGDRKALNRLLEDAHRRQFDCLLIWALDRLSREGISRMLGYLERLRQCDVRVLSHQEPWLDTGGPVSDLLIAIFGWVAAQERQRIRERILAGLKTAKAKGKRLGRPERQVDMVKLTKLRSRGFTLRQIAQAVGVPKSTVSVLLSRKSPPISASENLIIS